LINKVKHILIFTGMKKIINISILVLLFSGFFIGTFTSCKNDEDLTLPRLFSPVNFNVATTKTVATFTWAAVDSAASYTLQVSTDSLDYSTPVLDTTITKLFFIKELAGETQFYARVRANKSDTTIIKNSKFNSSISFKTPAENLFTGYGTNINIGKLYSAYMTDVHTLDMKWTPGANVTHLNLTSFDESKDTIVNISASEAATGEKTVSSLSNSNWKVEIYNNKILRGTTHGLVEGDFVVASATDLITALTNATSGQVILLAGGANFSTGSSAINFSKNVKIRSASPVNKAVVCMTNGTTSSSSNIFQIQASAALDSLVFENIEFTGYCDNVTTNTKIGYLFNNKTAYTVASIKFTNCNIHGFVNSPMRLSGGTGQRITNLTFNGCLLSDYTNTYAVVNVNSADYIDNITFANCTVYNFRSSFILRSGAYTMNSINLTNCTFNQGMLDPTNARFLVDANSMTITNGINIQNCIFGNTGSSVGANGIRNTAAIATVKVTGSYFTSDYVDDPIPAGATSTSIKANLTSYSGASTALWNDPVNGDFSLKDAAFAGKAKAGDLRWY
jgi:hypothetical protein